ncbi:MAG TPA: glycosyltransferase [Verrucomicrobiae bacterium]|nr:glycosyltransferase [Verrucomicrobiae bacterium]
MRKAANGPSYAGFKVMQNTSSNPEHAAGVCAIIVTYHPSAALIENVQAIRPQVAELVIIDNGSDEKSAKLLLQLEKTSSVRVIRNGKNLGIAAALNIGIRHAAAAEFAWVATFDQDSTVTPGFIEAMLGAYQSSADKERVALVSPVHCVSEEEWKKRSQRCKGNSTAWVAMTSGSLIKTRVLMENGLYDETMFIDYVDFDFCLRARRRGFKLRRAGRAFLLHCLGSLEAHHFFGMTLALTSHNATRCYYIMRNRVLMYRRYALSFPFWAFTDFVWMLVDFAKIIFFESEKRAKLSQAFRGIRDGLAGISGPMTPAAA